MLNRFSRILVVDDSATMRKVVSGMLHKVGYETVDQANDGRSALAMMQTKRYALVISDWNMTPMNGLELLNALKTGRPNQQVPFVMMTAHPVKFASLARENGAMHYLIKPFTVQQLCARMSEAFAGVAA